MNKEGRFVRPWGYTLVHERVFSPERGPRFVGKYWVRGWWFSGVVCNRYDGWSTKKIPAMRAVQ